MDDQQTVSSQAAVDKGMMIVSAAKAAAKAAEGTPYTPGGRAISGFDCSGFVYYVLHQVFPQYTYLTAAEIASSVQFTEVADPQAGDVVYFPPGPNPYEVHKGNTRQFPAHVGFIVDANWWIGRQTNNLGLVQRTNVWWQARGGVKHFRYGGAARTSLDFLKHRSRTSNA
jgi:cell wall-associated NlpC family hydrolase